MNKQEIKELINTENPTILEIGAHDGSDTNDFLQTFKFGYFYCFEPDPRCVKKHKVNVNDSRCKLFEVALSNENSKGLLYMSGGWPPDWPGSGDWDYSSSLKKPLNHLKMHPWCKFDKTTIVKTITLDQWTMENVKGKIIDFIWMDVQGAEGDVIKGGLNTLRYRTKYIYTEYANDEQYEGQLNLEAILKLLSNFVLLRQIDNNVLLKNLGLEDVRKDRYYNSNK